MVLVVDGPLPPAVGGVDVAVEEVDGPLPPAVGGVDVEDGIEVDGPLPLAVGAAIC